MLLPDAVELLAASAASKLGHVGSLAAPAAAGQTARRQTVQAEDEALNQVHQLQPLGWDMWAAQHIHQPLGCAACCVVV
jgi:hypothetical protein